MRERGRDILTYRLLLEFQMLLTSFKEKGMKPRGKNIYISSF